MNQTQLARVLDEYQPYVLREDGITDLAPALDGGYQPQWDDPAPIRHAPRPSFWKLYAYALLSSVGICLMAWALARLLERFL